MVKRETDSSWVRRRLELLRVSSNLQITGNYSQGDGEIVQVSPSKHCQQQPTNEGDRAGVAEAGVGT